MRGIVGKSGSVGVTLFVEIPVRCWVGVVRCELGEDCDHNGDVRN